MWDLEKWTYFQGRNRDAGVEKGHGDMERREWGVRGGERRVGRTESSRDIYTLPYANQTASGNLLRSTESSAVMTQKGQRECQEGGDLCIHINDSLRCTTETNTIV